MVRKGAEKTYNVKSLAKGRLQKVHKDAGKKRSANCTEPCARDENFVKMHKPEDVQSTAINCGVRSRSIRISRGIVLH